MITPKFSCSQDESSVSIELYVPSVRASELELHVDGTVFSVHINPYFLRLTFSSNLLEDDHSSASYDPSSGYLTVRLTKETKGEVFRDLDLLAKLLAPAPSATRLSSEAGEILSSDDITPNQPVIEVIGSTEVEDPVEALSLATAGMTLDQERNILLEAEKHDWHYPQEPPSEHISTSLERRYGFLDTYTGYFKHVEHTANEVNELGADAERLSPEERKQSRLEHEKSKWDEEYYLADFVNDAEIQELIAWRTPYEVPNEPFEFTEDENAVMLRLPRKEYLISATQSRELHLTLASILFSYAYDLRTTMDDPTPESAWTISSLTPAFSALDISNSPDVTSVLTSSYRRALAFPLYRNWDLCEQCRKDVAMLLGRGRRVVTRALLKTKRILDRHEVYYIYSKIWINDFIVWVQSYATDETLKQLSDQISACMPTKTSIGWSLEELEAATHGLEADSDDEDEN